MEVSTFTALFERAREGLLTREDINLIVGEIRSHAIAFTTARPPDKDMKVDARKRHALHMTVWLQLLPDHEAQKAHVLIAGTHGMQWRPLCKFLADIARLRSKQRAFLAQTDWTDEKDTRWAREAWYHVIKRMLCEMIGSRVNFMDKSEITLREWFPDFDGAVYGDLHACFALVGVIPSSPEGFLIEELVKAPGTP